MIHLGAVAALTAVSLAAAAADGELRAYSVPGHGKVEMVVPADWYDEPRQPPGGLPTVRFVDRLGSRPALDMSVTIAWSVGNEPSYTDAGRLRAFVSRAAHEAAGVATEPLLLLRELEGASGVGYYFQATIKSPLAGQPPHLTQGAIVVGSLLLTFTVFTADTKAPFVERALAMLKTARRVP